MMIPKSKNELVEFCALTGFLLNTHGTIDRTMVALLANNLEGTTEEELLKLVTQRQELSDLATTQKDNIEIAGISIMIAQMEKDEELDEFTALVARTEKLKEDIVHRYRAKALDIKRDIDEKKNSLLELSQI